MRRCTFRAGVMHAQGRNHIVSREPDISRGKGTGHALFSWTAYAPVQSAWRYVNDMVVKKPRHLVKESHLLQSLKSSTAVIRR